MEFKGLHGLIKIWGGDWNDCMNSAGLEGKGSSVWLSLAWCYANKLFGELAAMLGKTDDAAQSKARGEEFAATINDVAWDGEYYVCAYKDDGSVLGSHTNVEGKIFLIPQLWSIISGVVTPERLPKVLNTIDVALHDEAGTLVSKPGYSCVDNSIGIMGTKPAGVHENGGIYLHTMAWKLATDAILGRSSKLYESLQLTIPVTDFGEEHLREPYIMCNSVFGKETGYRYKTPGQSWRSASGQWLLKSLINFVFGLKPTMVGLRVEPCMPEQWDGASIEKQFRGSVYTITYKHTGESKLIVDGSPIDGYVVLASADNKQVSITCEF
jgi:cellobiose phosphorylase